MGDWSNTVYFIGLLAGDGARARHWRHDRGPWGNERGRRRYIDVDAEHTGHMGASDQSADRVSIDRRVGGQVVRLRSIGSCVRWKSPVAADAGLLRAHLPWNRKLRLDWSEQRMPVIEACIGWLLVIVPPGMTPNPAMPVAACYETLEECRTHDSGDRVGVQQQACVSAKAPRGASMDRRGRVRQ